MNIWDGIFPGAFSLIDNNSLLIMKLKNSTNYPVFRQSIGVECSKDARRELLNG